MSLINTQVQPFKTTAFVNRNGKGEIIESFVKRSDEHHLEGIHLRERAHGARLNPQPVMYQ